MIEGTIPDFEGRQVDSTTVVMSGKVPIGDALGEEVLSIDDVVQLVSMFKVVKVGHDVDATTGKLVRVQHLKPIEAALKPIDDKDPDDIGIIRALPRSIQGDDE